MMAQAADAADNDGGATLIPYIILVWALVSALAFAGLALRDGRPGEENRLFWMVMLAMAWPLVIGFFLFGTALWLFGSVAHLIKRQYRRL